MHSGEVIEIQIQDRYSKESVETRPASSQLLSDIDYFREYPHPLWCKTKITWKCKLTNCSANELERAMLGPMDHEVKRTMHAKVTYQHDCGFMPLGAMPIDQSDFAR